MNLNGMNYDELVDFWKEAFYHPNRVGRRLFPQRPKGYTAVTRELAIYAFNKATAMTCRLKGEIAEAESHERGCEGIYKAMPEYARW